MQQEAYERERAWLLAEKHNGVETPEFFTDLSRLQNGEPLAYIIGHIPFLDTIIHLDSHPLIPRPETEFWVEKAIAELRDEKRASLTILDMCAGSGCIGVAMLKEFPHARIDFAEIDAGHHATIQKNISENVGAALHTHIYSGDLFSQIPKEMQYDVIFSNPPYIDPARKERVEASVQAHEPEQALYGGTDGMEFIEQILKDAPDYLAAAGLLYIEHEPEQTKAIHAIAASLPYATRVTFKDQWGRERYTRLVHAG